MSQLAVEDHVAEQMRFVVHFITDQLNTAHLTLRSLDSGGMARTLKELINGPEPRHALMEPKIVVIGIAFYLLMKPLLAKICRSIGTTGKSVGFRIIALIHNILLCSYSFITAKSVIGLTSSHLRNHDLDSLYCGGGLWREGLGYWGFLFYLSKYWELVDTVLLIWKGRQPSFLQVYHHAMTILCAYMLQASHANAMFLFVGLNATVHTVMYGYYALCVLGWKFRGKFLITMMQIIQFCIGIGLAMPMFFMRNGDCSNEGQKIAVGGTVAHAVFLIKLFLLFYSHTYKGKKDKKV